MGEAALGTDKPSATRIYIPRSRGQQAKRDALIDPGLPIGSGENLVMTGVFCVRSALIAVVGGRRGCTLTTAIPAIRTGCHRAAA